MRVEHKANCPPVYSSDTENAWCSLPLILMSEASSPASPLPHPSHWPMPSRSILILSAFYTQVSQVDSFFQIFPTNTICIYLRRMPHAPTHLIYIHLIILTIFGKVYKSHISSHHTTVYILLLLPLANVQIFHQHLLFNTLHYLLCKVWTTGIYWCCFYNSKKTILAPTCPSYGNAVHNQPSAAHKFCINLFYSVLSAPSCDTTDILLHIPLI
jgi:hypothetical protein